MHNTPLKLTHFAVSIVHNAQGQVLFAQRPAVKRCLQILVLLFFVIFYTCVFASDEVDQFAKTCDLINQNDYYGGKNFLKKEIRKLKQAGVPIQLSFNECEIAYIIKLTNGGIERLQSSFATNAESDNKGTVYEWEPHSPSSNEWLFGSGGWEWGGFTLINKMTGRAITETTECGNYQIRMSTPLIAVICQGNYENEAPTLYLIDSSKKTPVWSEPIPIEGCEARSKILVNQFKFINRKRIFLSGHCELKIFSTTKKKSKNRNLTSRSFTPVRTLFKPLQVNVDSDGLVVFQSKVQTNIRWKHDKSLEQ